MILSVIWQKQHHVCRKLLDPHQSPIPTFHCYACGDKSESLSLVAQLSHVFGPPATLAAIQLIQEYIGHGADGFVELYSKHNGLTLYRDRKGDAEGLRLYKVEDWESRTQEMKNWYSDMDEYPRVWLKHLRLLKFLTPETTLR